MRNLSYWILERHNPQLGVYYVACGQITKSEATKKEHPLYGYNVMHEYKTEAVYLSRIEELKRKGNKVQ